MSTHRLRIALAEYDTGWHDVETSMARAADLIERAAGQGGRLVVLPEMCSTGFTMDSATRAEPANGPAAQRLAGEAERHGVYVLAGLATRRDDRCYNSAVLYGPDGMLHGAYDKQRCFAYGGEDRSYAPGDEGAVFEIDGVRAAPFICYDLRFPELFLAVAPFVDVAIVVANWPESRRAHWDALIRARAIENQMYVAAVNRIGSAGGLRYDGGSVLIGPWGDAQPLERHIGAGGAVLLGDVDTTEVTRVRSKYPFRVDRRAEGDVVPALVSGWARTAAQLLP